MTHLVVAVDNLIKEARGYYAKEQWDLTLVAVPTRLRPKGEGIGLQRCAPGSPNVWQVQNGALLCAAQSIRFLGSTEVPNVGPVEYIAFDGNGQAISTFVEFCGKAAAALFEARPRWFDRQRSGGPLTIWSTAIMFGSPSAYSLSACQPTGPWVLDRPWAGSLNALNDIFGLPALTFFEPDVLELPPAAEKRITPAWNRAARLLTLQNGQCKQYRRPAPNQFKILNTFDEDEWPKAIEDPLKPGKLAATIDSLNRNLQLIKFHLNTDGAGVYWTIQGFK
ncbi:hypothetical protein [Limnoglobus roseus]|uniref:Uncharacterized protein n=1 Tax=Limnoglobus roseus TaxID=2598579 RepID=A0A5C1AKH8_9BACT|nr:hypothetical protein [Limnoglobus roseus]QEL19165.1 hypothetical protein PX52LOC_06223 [Limnoglobus roseus]